MSHSLISRSPDLKRLRDEGFEVAVQGGYLVLTHVPYLNGDQEVCYGTLVSALTLAGDVTVRPADHVVMFAGEAPCGRDGRILQEILNASTGQDLGDGLLVHHTFSSKPGGGYDDYYHKMATYINILAGPAQALDPQATAQTFAVIEDNQEAAVFRYLDTAESRAGLGVINRKLALAKVAIVGLGGTGSYILDLVVKTPVVEIHLIDGDDFLSHNAFRAPGAATVGQLRERPKKVDYFAAMYSPMRRGILPHACYLDCSNLGLLAEMSFVFLSLAAGSDRDAAIGYLTSKGIPFVDVGMGVYEAEEAFGGLLRATSNTDQRWRATSKGPAAMPDRGQEPYARNIQIADLNALNAALAVVKWKKMFGFYLDFENETSAVYQIDSNVIFREDRG